MACLACACRSSFRDTELINRNVIINQHPSLSAAPSDSLQQRKWIVSIHMKTAYQFPLIIHYNYPNDKLLELHDGQLFPAFQRIDLIITMIRWRSSSRVPGISYLPRHNST